MHANEHSLIFRALDEELRHDEAEALRHLLNHSPEARAELKALQSMRRLIAEHGGSTFDPGFTSRVMQRLPTHPHRSARSPRRRKQRTLTWRRLCGAVAACIVLIGVGLALSRLPETVHVPYGATQVVTLPDGSTAELSAGTQLHYAPFWASRTRRVTLDGEAFFEVVDGERPFVVETFNARVVVHGTRFNVRAWREDPSPETNVTLASGRVDLVPNVPDANAVTLAPGETSAVVGDTTEATMPDSVAIERALSWRSGGLSFINQPLGSALRELERRFGFSIQLNDPTLADTSLTYLNPQPGSPPAVLSAVCHVLDLRYRRTAEGYVILRK